MKTIPPETETEAEESDFKPLTAQEAQQWRSRHPPLSVGKVVAGQALVGMLVALVAWVLVIAMDLHPVLTVLGGAAAGLALYWLAPAYTSRIIKPTQKGGETS